MNEDQKSNELSRHVQHHNQAFDAHESMYAKRYPPPIKPQVRRDSFIVPIALVCMILSSVIVSGSRTIVEFGGDLVGGAAFVMLEIGIVAYSFFRTRRSADDDRKRLGRVQKLAERGLWLAFLVAVAANVHAVLAERGIILNENINTIINILVAISAPTLAFISGDVLALEMVISDARKRRADEQYAIDINTWREGMLSSWSGQKAKLGVKAELPTLEAQTDRPVVSVLSVSDQTDSRQTARAAYGHTRTPDGQTKVVEYLHANPDAAQLSSRKLAELVGVGHDTANKGRNAYLANGHSSNGNGHKE